MSATEADRVPKAVRSVWPALILIAASAGMIVWSTRYNPTAREVPLLVGYLLLVLSVIDLLCRLDLPFSGPLRAFWGADFRNPEMKHDPTVWHQVLEVAWMVACVAGMMLVGILPVVPVYIILYTRLSGRLSWAVSIATGLVVFVFVYVVFEYLLDYPLYRGALFEEQGFAGW